DDGRGWCVQAERQAVRLPPRAGVEGDQLVGRRVDPVEYVARRVERHPAVDAGQDADAVEPRVEYGRTFGEEAAGFEARGHEGRVAADGAGRVAPVGAVAP